MLNIFRKNPDAALSNPGKLVSRRLVAATCSLLLLSLTTSAQALQIDRGPYLQSGSTTGVTVKWRTDSNSSSVVDYGTNPANLNLSEVQNGSRINHEVTLSGLLPDTKYYYSVGDGVDILAGADNNHFFTTSPNAGTTKSFRIWAVGDSGTANSSARSVRDAYKNFTGARGTDLMLMLGDNAYNDGTDSQYQRAVFDMYPEILRNTVLWSTRGNHERSASTYFNIFAFPKNGEAGGVPSGTEAYYSFDYGNIHFIVLDSEGSSRSTNGAMLKWLDNDAATTTKEWIVAFWHHPPYTKGSHNSDSEGQLIDMRRNALPILEAHGVDLVLSGHSHSYERTFLINGHYGNSNSFGNSNLMDGGDGNETGSGAYQKPGGLTPNEGAVYIVAGASGKVSGGRLNHRAMHISMSRLGSVVIDVKQNRMDVLYLESNGNTLDNFTLLKSGVTNLPPVANAGPDQTVDEGATVTLDGSGIDPDGSVVAYEWSQLSGPAMVLTNASSATASFTAPDVAANTVLRFRLEVTDDDGATDRNGINITVNDTTGGGNLPPTADAGPDQTVDEGASVTLAGSGSDPDGTIAAYKWTQASGSEVVLTNPNSATASFTAPSVAANTVLNFNLEVTDNGGLTHSDPVAVTVNNTTVGNNLPPVSDAGPDQTEDEGAIVSLDGSGSTDPDGSVVAYKWIQLSGPSVVISNPRSVTASFTTPNVTKDTVLRIRLRVKDDSGIIDRNAVNITVQDTTVSNGVDLVINKLTVTGSPFRVGKRLRPKAVVLNSGSAKAGKNKMRFVISTDPVIDAGDLTLGKLKTVFKIRGGKSRVVRGSFRIPTTVVPGTYYLGAMVDDSKVVVESNETNNTAVLKIEILPKKKGGGDD